MITQLVTGGTGTRTQKHLTPRPGKCPARPLPHHCCPKLGGHFGCLGIWVKVAETLEAAWRENGSLVAPRQTPSFFSPSPHVAQSFASASNFPAYGGKFSCAGAGQGTAFLLSSQVVLLLLIYKHHLE